MKKCNPKVGKSFLDIYEFLNKSLATHPHTIRQLELDLHILDPDFTLNILSKEDWIFPSCYQVLSHAANHTIYIQEDFYNNAMENDTDAALILAHEFIHYIYLTNQLKKIIKKEAVMENDFKVKRT